MLKQWIKEIKQRIKIKWIKGECRHLCFLCKYKGFCYKENKFIY